MFGASVVAVYNLAYNLADIPAAQVGEHVGDVLVPSFVHLAADRQKAGVVRATGLVCLLVFPLAVGLGVVGPTLATTLLPPAWASLGPMLTVLSVLSVVRPIGWTIGSYLQTTQRSGVVMGLSAFRLVALLAAVGALGQAFGPLGACAGVGVAFTLHALASALYVIRRDGLPGPALLAAIVRPLAACVPLALAALGAPAAVAAMGIGVRGVALAPRSSPAPSATSPASGSSRAPSPRISSASSTISAVAAPTPRPARTDRPVSAPG